MMRFWKYHGAGNDFVLLDGREDQLRLSPELAVRLCQRRLGVGADGVLLLEPSSHPRCDVSMRIVNADGSLAQMCGNGLRCVAKHLLDPVPGRAEVTVETGAGPLSCTVHRDAGGMVETVRVDMGRPILERAAIPLAGEGPGVREEIRPPGGDLLRFTGVSMGNPHAVVFFDGAEGGDLSVVGLARHLGPGLVGHERFPEGANVAFVRPEGGRLVAAVFERGAGLTAACGTGACAIGVAAGLEERVPFGTPVEVLLPGGALTVEVEPELGNVAMTGPARLVFSGELDPDSLSDPDACRGLTVALGQQWP